LNFGFEKRSTARIDCATKRKASLEARRSSLQAQYTGLVMSLSRRKWSWWIAGLEKPADAALKGGATYDPLVGLPMR
jgi:hypothetical protein